VVFLGVFCFWDRLDADLSCASFWCGFTPLLRPKSAHFFGCLFGIGTLFFNQLALFLGAINQKNIEAIAMRVTSNRLCTAVAAAMLVSAPLSQAQLEEVIVTATKVESSIQDTPIAVSAFTQDQLDSQLINDTMNLQFSVPT
jgi:hypothetical protein